MEEELYYIQDSRNYCGNSIMWWRYDSCGYTTNLDEAKKVTKDWSGRDTDILRRATIIDKIATRQVDVQLLIRI